MNLKDFLFENVKKRRILITKDVARTNALIRRFEKEEEKLIENVECQSFMDFCKQLFIYYESEQGFKPEYEIIDDTKASIILRSLMLNSIKDFSFFTNEKLFTFATCTEILKKINLVRGCGWNGKEDSSNRVADIKLLIQKYEDILTKEKKLDYFALLKYIENKFNGSDIKKDIRLCFDGEVSYLVEDTELFTQKELALLSMITADCINIWDCNPNKAVLEAAADKLSFFKGYGSFNEASYIANDIAKNNYPLESVSVLCTNQAQLDAISSALIGNNLNVVFSCDKSLKDNSYIALARRILAWAMDDYSESALEKIFISCALRNEYVGSDGNTHNALGGETYVNHIFDAKKRRGEQFSLGWGYERNVEFVKREEALANSLATAQDVQPWIKKLEVHRDLLGIFSDGSKAYSDINLVKPSIVFNGLLGFMWKYQNKAAELAIGKSSLNMLREVVALEDRELSLTECIAFLDELILGLQGSEEVGANTNAIKVGMLSDWKQIETDIVYIIGLSLRETKESTTQSPILSDEEMEGWLGSGYKPTIENKTALRDLNIYRTLDLFKGKKIVLGYQYYNTVEFSGSSPSMFYLDALKACGKRLEDVPSFVYGNPVNGVTNVASAFNPKSSYEIKLQSSNSKIEIFTNCPKQYFYSQIKKLPDNEYFEKDITQWLNPMYYGLLFHAVADRYCNEMFIKPNSEPYAASVDEKILLSIIGEEVDNMSKVCPVPLEDQKKQEAEDFVKVCKEYFTKIHARLVCEELGWRVLATELFFEKCLFDIEDYLGNKYEFSFNGQIDRIDYKLEENKVLLRIVDYKTGKYENKVQDDGLGKVIQHAIYRKAILKTILDQILERICELENNQAIKTFEVEFSDFSYHFPKEEDNWIYQIGNAEIEGKNITRLKAALTALKDLSEFPDHEQLYNKIKEYGVTYSSKDPFITELSEKLTKPQKGVMVDEENKNCDYCSYGDICPAKKGGVK